MKQWLCPWNHSLNIVIDNPESLVELWVQSLVTMLCDYLLLI
jgi:hypothetical protein